MWEKLIFLAAYKGIEFVFRRIERRQQQETKREALYREAMERFRKYKEMGDGEAEVCK